jgi:hypothetical protein
MQYEEMWSDILLRCQVQKKKKKKLKNILLTYNYLYILSINKYK